MQRIKHIIKKEFRQIRRDRSMIGIIFIMPIMQLIVLGYVISSEVTNISTVICDLDNSYLSREVVRQIDNSGYFNIHYYERDQDKIAGYLDFGKAAVAIVIPEHFARNIALQRKVKIQILLDGQDVNTATITLGYLNGIIQNMAAEQALKNLSAVVIEKGQSPHFIREEARFWYNPDLRNSDYMVPGIAAYLLTIVTALLSAMGLVKEREIGTLEQLLVTPIKKHELLIGKIIPFAILGFFELGIALVFARFWYHIPIVGNLGLFALFTVIYLFTTLGLGLFVSAISYTQQQALFMVWFIMVFIFLMSGFIFPIENMPLFAQALSYLNPLRYFMIVIREIFIKGSGLQYLYWQGIALAIFGAVIFSFAALLFQRRIK